MSGSIAYRVRVVATGFMVLVLFAIPLFCGRFYCAFALVTAMPEEARQVQASPSGLLPLSMESGPDVNKPSVAQARITNREILLHTLGIADYIESRQPGGRCCDVLYSAAPQAWMQFDRPSGLIAFRGWRRVGDDEAKTLQPFSYHAGPKGMSDAPANDLGQFVAPVVAVPRFGPQGVDGRTHPAIVYDRALRRFFRLDWERQTVRAGSQQAASYDFRGFASQGPSAPHVDWDPPMRAERNEDATDSRRQYDWHPMIPFAVGDAGRHLPVLTASRRIDLLDRQTLELVRDKGFLPAPKTLCGEGVARPGQLLDYDVLPIYTGDELEYTGLLAASVSRQGTSLALAMFDASGRPFGRIVHSRGRAYADDSRLVDSERFAMLETPKGPVLTACKYVLETLHPPVLTLASFSTADQIDARAGHRSLFLMPSSFAAMQRDRIGSYWVWNFLRVLWIMLPAFALAVFLGWRVLRDAARIGLSENASLLWLVGTLALGLPAYITYRLTRPARGLVTCGNCGQMRRTDAETCHRCGRPWLVPELIAPAWRVLGAEEEQGGDDTPAHTEEMASDATCD